MRITVQTAAGPVPVLAPDGTDPDELGSIADFVASRHANAWGSLMRSAGASPGAFLGSDPTITSLFTGKSPYPAPTSTNSSASQALNGFVSADPTVTPRFRVRPQPGESHPYSPSQIAALQGVFDSFSRYGGTRSSRSLTHIARFPDDPEYDPGQPTNFIPRRDDQERPQSSLEVAYEESPKFIDKEVDTVLPWLLPSFQGIPVVDPVSRYVSDIAKGGAKAVLHSFNPFEGLAGAANALTDPWGALKGVGGQAYDVVRPDATAEERGSGLANTLMLLKGGVEAYHGLFKPFSDFHAPMRAPEAESPWSPMMSGSDAAFEEPGAGYATPVVVDPSSTEVSVRKTAKAAKRISQDHPPITSRDLSDDQVVRDLTEYFGKVLDEPEPKDFVAPYSDDVARSNQMLDRFYDGKLTGPHRDLVHFLSSMASGSVYPALDSLFGTLLFDRFFRTGELSPYVGDAKLWTKNLFGERVGIDVRDVKNGIVRPAKATLAFDANAVNRVADMLKNKFGGDLGETMQWLKTKHPNQEIEEVTGRKLPGHEYTEDPESFGIFGVTGAKYGSYFLNRVGELSTAPKDLWYARMMSRLLGEPLLKVNGEPITRALDPGDPENLRIRRLTDVAANLAGEPRGMQLGEVSGRLWANERALYDEYGAAQRPSLMADGVSRALERIQGGNGLERYAEGRRATSAEARESEVSKAISKLQGRLYAGEPLPEGGDSAMDAGSPRVGGYTRDARLPSRALLSLRGLDPSAVQTVSTIARYKPLRTFSQAIRSVGGSKLAFFEVADPAQYHEIVQRLQDEHPLGATMQSYSPEDYARMRKFVSEDGKSVLALDGDNIVSFLPSEEGDMAAHSMLQLATDLGGRSIDTFDTRMPRTLSQMGFKAVARVPFADELAPEGWDANAYRGFNNGRPDVVHMVWDPAHMRPYTAGEGTLVRSAEDAVAKQMSEISRLRRQYDLRRSKLRY